MQCFQKLNWKDTFTLGLQSTRMCAQFSYNDIRDAIRKMVKKLSSDKRYGKTAGIFSILSLSQKKACVCVYNV